MQNRLHDVRIDVLKFDLSLIRFFHAVGEERAEVRAVSCQQGTMHTSKFNQHSENNGHDSLDLKKCTLNRGGGRDFDFTRRYICHGIRNGTDLLAFGYCTVDVLAATALLPVEKGDATTLNTVNWTPTVSSSRQRGKKKTLCF